MSRPPAALDWQAQLWDAAAAGDTDAMGQALAGGAKPDSLDVRRAPNGRRALNWAALGNHAAAIRLLLTPGASIDSGNLTGFTPLHHAAEVGAMEAARALLQAGADPRRLNRAGFTAVQIARENGFEPVAAVIEEGERARGRQPAR